MIDKLGIVMALDREARAIFGSRGWQKHKDLYYNTRLVHHKEVFVVLSGQGGARANAVADLLAERGCSLVLNMGVSGALKNGLGTGAIVLPRLIKGDEGLIEITFQGYNRIFSVFEENHLDFHDCPVFTSKSVICSPEHKAELCKSHSACAVDQEAFFIARSCLDTGMDVLVIKAISDTSSHTIPNCIIKCVDEYGGVRPLLLIYTILKQPSLISSLFILGRGFNKALSSLKQAFNIAIGVLL